MFRQPAQRYQRAKGLKVKHVLQMVIVTVVLTWMAYELNQSRNPANSKEQDRSVFQDTSLGRRALKPEDNAGEKHLEIERVAGTDDNDSTAKSFLEENVDGDRVEENDNQRDKNISGLDMERDSDQGTFFEELKNEQERAEQEEIGDNERDGDPLKREVNVSSSGRKSGSNHVASGADGDKKVGQPVKVTFMDAFKADSVLKHKLDKLDEGQVEETSRAHVDEKIESATDTLKEATVDLAQEIGEENSDQNEDEVSQKEVDEEALNVSEGLKELEMTKDNADNQSIVGSVESNQETQSNDQTDVNKEKLSAKSREEGKAMEKVEGKAVEKVETQEQKHLPARQPIGEVENDSLSHVQKEQGKDEKKQDDEWAEKKVERNGTESVTQSELKSEGIEVDVSEKNGNQHEKAESLKSVVGELDNSTQKSEGENKSLVQSDEGLETDDNQRRLATEKVLRI